MDVIKFIFTTVPQRNLVELLTCNSIVKEIQIEQILSSKEIEHYRNLKPKNMTDVLAGSLLEEFKKACEAKLYLSLVELVKVFTIHKYGLEDSRHWMAFETACDYDLKEVIIALKMDLKANKPLYESIWRKAVMRGSLITVKTIEEILKDEDTSKMFVLTGRDYYQLALDGHEAMVKRRSSYFRGGKGIYSLRGACRGGHNNLVEWLLQQKVFINEEVLVDACDSPNDDPRIIELLLQQRQTNEIFTHTVEAAAYYCCSRAYLQKARKFIEYGRIQHVECNNCHQLYGNH